MRRRRWRVRKTGFGHALLLDGCILGLVEDDEVAATRRVAAALNDFDERSINLVAERATAVPVDEGPIPMLLWCPECGARHVDEGEFAEKPHATHACQGCGIVWKPAKVPTTGVRFLPGYRNDRARIGSP